MLISEIDKLLWRGGGEVLYYLCTFKTKLLANSFCQLWTAFSGKGYRQIVEGPYSFYSGARCIIISTFDGTKYVVTEPYLKAWDCNQFIHPFYILCEKTIQTNPGSYLSTQKVFEDLKALLQRGRTYRPIKLFCQNFPDSIIFLYCFFEHFVQ